MNSSNYNVVALIRKVFYLSTFFLVAAGVWAQDTSTTRIQHGIPTHETTVRNATVVYVEGNDLVLKVESGKVEHLVVPDSDKFIIDGKTVSVYDLKSGTRLSQSITTTTTPHYVNTVRVLKGKVWHVTAPHSVIVSLPNGKNHQYTVPNHAKFIVNGEPKTVFDLKKGMKFEATIVTDESETVVLQSKSNVGQAPPPALPPVVGVLLIQRPDRPVAPTIATEKTPEPITVASTEPNPATLPKTGSYIPLMGLMGALAVAASLAMGTVRRRSMI